MKEQDHSVATLHLARYKIATKSLAAVRSTFTQQGQAAAKVFVRAPELCAAVSVGQSKRLPECSFAHQSCSQLLCGICGATARCSFAPELLPAAVSVGKFCDPTRNSFCISALIVSALCICASAHLILHLLRAEQLIHPLPLLRSPGDSRASKHQYSPIQFCL